MSQVISIIQSILYGPENHSIFVSFQNILNHHYNKVFDIIYSFSDITLKEIKEFKIFEKREMPQEFKTIEFSDKYKKAVFLFYELLSKNPKSGDKFVKLLDTLPHNKEIAICILKLKLQLKKEMKGGGDENTPMPFIGYANTFDNVDVLKESEKYGMATNNLFRVFHAVYNIGIGALELALTGLIKQELQIDIPLATKEKNKAVSDFYNVVQSGGNVEELYQSASKILAEKIIEYFNVIKNSQGVKKIKDFLNAKNMGSYLDAVGTAATVQTLVPLESLKLMSSLMHAASSKMMEINVASQASSKNADEIERNKFHNLHAKLSDIQNSLIDLLKKMQESFSDKIKKTITELKVDDLKEKIGIIEPSIDTVPNGGIGGPKEKNTNEKEASDKKVSEPSEKQDEKADETDIPKDIQTVIQQLTTDLNSDTKSNKIDKTIFYIVLLYKKSKDIIANINDMDNGDFNKIKIDINAKLKDFNKTLETLKSLQFS